MDNDHQLSADSCDFNISTLTAPDEWDRLAVYRLADMEGKPVLWRGQKISPDYRPGHTTHPEYMGRGPR